MQLRCMNPVLFFSLPDKTPFQNVYQLLAACSHSLLSFLSLRVPYSLSTVHVSLHAFLLVWFGLC